MEQVYSAALSMLQLMTVAQLPKQGGSGDSSSSDFSKLLEQKTDAAKPAADSSKPTAANGQDAPASDKVSTEQNASKQEEMEQPCYDIAQQLACAQMVWVNVGAAPEQQVSVAEADMVLTGLESTAVQTPVTAEAVQAPVLGEAVQQVMQPAEQQDVQLGAQPAAESLPQESVQAVQPQAQQTETEDGVGTQLFEDAKAEISVEQNDTDDKVAEEAPLFQNVEAAPIKVAEAPAQTEQAEAPMADVETQVKEKLTQALESGESKVEIKLTPDTLGSLKVEITQDHSGVMHIVINAESSQTRGLLEKHVSGLQSMLADRGYQTAQIEVRNQQESHQADERQGNFHDGRNGQSGQQQERRQQHAPRTEDFLQQLRLGLIPLEEVS